MAKRHTKVYCQDLTENERLGDLGGIFMKWPLKKDRLKPRMAPNVINLRILELETAKEILGSY